MPWKLNKTGRDGLIVLCALLSIWICAIILPKDGEHFPRETISQPEAKPVLIIDPGHGGLDGGASTSDGVPESRLNLEISLRVRDTSSFLGVSTILTREGNSLAYPAELTSIAACKRWDTRQRVEMINSTENAVLMSIHQNYYPSASPHGAQVLYAPGEDSQRFGECTQALLTQHLLPENRRVAEPVSRDIYILNHIRCPAILVECGFLSNPQEAARLGSEEYQIQLALVLADSFLRFTEGIHA